MSVVNKMLSDLENRPHHVQKTANYVPPKSRKLLWTGITVSVIFCLSIAITTYIKTNSSLSSPVEQTEQMSFDPNKGDQIAQHSPKTKTSEIVDRPTISRNEILDRPTISRNTSNPAETLQASNQLSLANMSQTKVAKPNRTNNNESVSIKKAIPADVTTKTKQQVQNTQSNGMSALKIKPSDGAKSQLSQLRAQAHHASQLGEEQRVIETLHKIIELAPEDLRTRKQLAAMLFSKQDLQAALLVLQQALIQAPADSSSRLMLSRIYYKTGKHSAALDILKAHPHPTLANDELLSFRAALAESIGQYGVAQSDYQLLVNRNPSEAKWWLGLGVSQDKQQLATQAIASYEQAKSLNQLPQQVDTFVEQRIRLLARRS